MSYYPVFLGAVVVDDTNDTIRITEDGTGYDAVIGNGIYFLSNDAGGDDLCLAIMDALSAASAGGNAYSVTPSFSVDGSGVSCTVTIARSSGSRTVSINWTHANTTFDPTQIGFAGTADSTGSTSYASTLSPKSVWVSNEIYASLDLTTEHTAFSTRARSGRVLGGLRGSAYDVRLLQMQFLHAKRAHSANNTSDPSSGLDRFITRQLAGLHCQFHLASISSGTTLAALSGSTEHGSGWHFDAEQVADYSPQRLGPGIPLYSASLRLLGYV
jgi:hypothetical protein